MGTDKRLRLEIREKIKVKDSSDHIIKRVKKPYIESQRNQSCLTPWRWKTTQGTSLNQGHGNDHGGESSIVLRKHTIFRSKVKDPSILRLYDHFDENIYDH